MSKTNLGQKEQLEMPSETFFMPEIQWVDQFGVEHNGLMVLKGKYGFEIAPLQEQLAMTKVMEEQPTLQSTVFENS